MPSGQIIRYELSERAFRAVPVAEREVILSLGHMANELAILHKLSAWSVAGDGDVGEPVLHGRVVQTLFLLGQLSGKLAEGHELLRKSFWNRREISSEYTHSVSSKAEKSLSNIKKYFSRSDNFVTKVRHGYAFHYPSEGLASSLEDLDADEPLLFYSCDSAMNCLYYFSEVAVAGSIFDGLDWAKITAFMDVLKELSMDFLNFVVGCFEVFFKKYPDILKGDSASEVEMDSFEVFDQVRIPFFAKLHWLIPTGHE